MKTGNKLLIAAALMVASHNVPAWEAQDQFNSWGSGSWSPSTTHDPYSSTMPQDSYVTPHVWGGGYTETYPGRGSITVTPDGMGGHIINRRGFIPRNRW